MVAELEQRIDHYMDQVDLPPQFVIPGGNQLSAQLDVARTTIRRAERRLSALNEAGELAEETVIHFVNRASDLRLRPRSLRRRRRSGAVRGPAALLIGR